MAKGGAWRRAACGEGRRVARCDAWQRGEWEGGAVSEKKEKKKKKKRTGVRLAFVRQKKGAAGAREKWGWGTTRPRTCQREGVPNTCREKRKGQQEGRKEREEKKKYEPKENLPNLRQGGGCVRERGEGEDTSQSVGRKDEALQRKGEAGEG